MIGYYVHDHGSGHAQRFVTIRRSLPDLVGLGSGPRPRGIPAGAWIALPSDAGAAPARDPTAGGSLHWAPLREPDMLARTAAIANWAREHRPAALVVDVSVEVAVTARLLSIPTVVVAQHGVREDAPHELGYRCASAIAALWPAGAAPDPPGAGNRLVHVGPISRFDERAASLASAARASGAGPDDAPTSLSGGLDRRPHVVLMLGSGGHDLPVKRVRNTAATVRSWRWTLLGDHAALGPRVDDEAHVWNILRSADVVIAAASNNCVAEVAAARRRLVVLPQVRPFDEQTAHARALSDLDLAHVLTDWPDPIEFEQLLRHVVQGAPPKWETYHDGLGAQRLAAVIKEVARP